MDHSKAIVENLISRTDELLKTGILFTDIEIFYKKSIYVEVLINLKDLLQRAKKAGNRISFKDYVEVDEKISDVTDLISNFRDAFCHSDSYRNNAGDSLIPFIEQIGQTTKITGAVFNIDGPVIIGNMTGFQNAPVNMINPFNDDVMYVVGSKRLFLKRHIIRAFEEVCAFFNSYYE